jgi:hypothetical protein
MIYSASFVIYITSFNLLCGVFLFAQNKKDMNFTFETPHISGGAEFIIMLQEAIRNENVDMFRYFDQSTPPPPYSPSAITAFDGFDFDDNPTYNSGFRFIPPDPIAAAGTDRVIAVVNTMIECRTKTGTLLWINDLADFFSPVSPTTFTFDPKVIYDQYENRFLVVTLEVVESGSNPSAGNISRILLAVSKNSTPATSTSADWAYTSIDSKLRITGRDYWADYPGFAIDEEAVYITANMFIFSPFSGGSSRTRLWIVDKGVSGGFYSGGSASVTGDWNFPGLSGGFAGTHQPAHVFGSTGVATGVGTFLVLYSGLTTGGAGGTEAIQVIRVDDPLGSPSFNLETVTIGDIEDVGGSFGWPALPDAPQSGSSTDIEVNDRRTLSAVWRNNSLWISTTINPNSGPDIGETTAHWIQLNTTTLDSTFLTDQGNIGGEDIAADTYTFFPSIAVNSSGDMIVGFSASASTMYAGAYYAGRYSGDPAGNVNPSVVIKAGLDFYVRKFSGTRNRWGDYSGACVDPSDDESFWVFNEYAMTRGSGTAPDDGRWGTVYGYVPISELPVELISFTASVVKGEVILNWVTETEVNNYGFDIERKKEYESWNILGFAAGNGNTNSPKDYSFIDKTVTTSGKYFYRLKQLDNDGSYEYSKSIYIDFDVPSVFKLEQNYPNPFNPETAINFTLPVNGYISLKVFNTLGEEVQTLFEGDLDAGAHTYIFNAKNHSSGIYMYKLSSNNFTQTKKMLLLK